MAKVDKKLDNEPLVWQLLASVGGKAMILQSTICLPCRTKCNVHSEIQWEMCNICYINLFSVHLLHCEVNSPSSRAQQFNCSLHTASQSILLHSWLHCIVLELFGRLLKGLMPVWKTKWVEAQVTPNWLFIPFSIKHPPPPSCDIINALSKLKWSNMQFLFLSQGKSQQAFKLFGGIFLRVKDTSDLVRQLRVWT